MIAPDESDSAPLLEMLHIGKSFPGVRALQAVNLQVQAGEFHSIVGENGAGKSTLIKILSGVYPAGDYEGEIRLKGAVQRFRNVRDSEAAGIAVVHQELALVPEMSAAENILLGNEPRRGGAVRWKALYHHAQEVVSRLKININIYAPVRTLGVGQRQLVAIARSLTRETRILILDEPTAALTESESATLFEVLRALRSRGVAVVYISHRLAEVFQLSDRITVLRDGASVHSAATAELNEAKVISLMVGRDLNRSFAARACDPGATALEVRDISLRDPSTGVAVLDGINFSVRKGEILGIAGLVGAGRSELLMALFGAATGGRRGEILVAGKRVAIHKPADAIRCGIGFVTEDRRQYGLVLGDDLVRNTNMASFGRCSRATVMDERAEISATVRTMKELRTKPASPFVAARTLSGGNQQKIVLAKWLLTAPKVLFLDEPTRGVDVGARQEFYRLITELAEQGLAIVLVSSELEEVLGLSDRVLVMHRGRITGDFPRKHATSERIMACAIGQAQELAG